MGRPKLLGITYARLAQPVVDGWQRLAASGTPKEQKTANARLRGLQTLENRIRANVLGAGDVVERDRWPGRLKADYGEVGNLFRFELPDAWRGYYTLVGEDDPPGVRVFILYIVDHPTYDEMSGYRKK